MKFFDPNIQTKGRLIRLTGGALCIALSVALVLLTPTPWWVALFPALAGVFAIFEGARGWCVLRACKIKTPF